MINSENIKNIILDDIINIENNNVNNVDFFPFLNESINEENEIDWNVISDVRTNHDIERIHMENIDIQENNYLAPQGILSILDERDDLKSTIFETNNDFN